MGLFNTTKRDASQSDWDDNGWIAQVDTIPAASPLESHQTSNTRVSPPTSSLGVF